MLQTDPDRELKLIFINRQKRLYENILRQLEEGQKKGITSEETLQQYKNSYNSIVFEDAKKAYLQHKLKHSRKRDYIEDLFSTDI